MIHAYCLRAVSAAILSLTPAVASAEGFYAKLFGAASDLSGTTAALGADSGPATFDAGFLAGGAIGYAYPGSNLRAEVEYAYRTGDVAGLPAGIGPGDNFASTAIMVNGHYVFSGTAGWSPYVGLGLGALTEIDLDLTTPEAEYSARGVLAYQLMLGVEVALSERASLFGELRHLDAGRVDMTGPGGALSADYATTDLGVGLSFRF